MKINNPFHRATPAERAVKQHAKEVKSQQQSLELMKANEDMVHGERRAIQRDVRKAQRDITKFANTGRREAGRGNLQEARAAIVERKRMEQVTDKLRQANLMLGNVEAQARLTRAHAIMTNAVKNTINMSERVMPEMVNPDEFAEGLEKLDDAMVERDEALNTAFDRCGLEESAEAEVEEELQALMERNQTTVSPYQPQRVAPVAVQPQGLEEEEA
jgi:hypothetical protein